MDKIQRKKWEILLGMWSKGKILSSIELAKKYLKEYPKDAFSWYVLGDSLTQIAQYKKAKNAIQKAKKYCSSDKLDMVYSLMGRLYQENGRFRIAERWFRQAIKTNPKRTNNLIYLGAILAKQGRFSEAKKFHRRAAKLSTDTWDEAYFNLGLIHRAENNFNDAIKCFNKVLEIDPKYKIALVEKQDALEAQKIRKGTYDWI